MPKIQVRTMVSIRSQAGSLMRGALENVVGEFVVLQGEQILIVPASVAYRRRI
jgi:hypothetical protein